MRAATPRNVSLRPLRGLLVAAALALPCLGGVVVRAAEEEQGPLAVAPEAVDFGAVKQHASLSRALTLRNEGKAPIRNIRMITDCGCYTITLPDTSIEPAGTSEAAIQFRTLTFAGPVRKKLRLAYEEAGKARTVTVPLRLEVVGGVVARPGRLHFGELLEGETPEGTLHVVWYEGHGEPFEIASVKVADPRIEAHVSPKGASKRKDERGWELRFRFKRPPPRGVFSTQAEVRTTSKTQPKVLIPLTANVVGKVWVQRRRVYLGMVRQGQGRSVDVRFRPTRPEFKLGSVRVRARKGRVKAEIPEGLPPGRRGARTLRISIPPDAAPGPIDDVVELLTDVPGDEVVPIEIRGRVFASGKSSQKQGG